MNEQAQTNLATKLTPNEERRAGEIAAAAEERQKAADAALASYAFGREEAMRDTYTVDSHGSVLTDSEVAEAHDPDAYHEQIGR